MIVPFDYNGTRFSLNTETNLVFSKLSQSTAPLMSCHTDLRNAAVRAKVQLLRQRSREQSNPLDLQGN